MTPTEAHSLQHCLRWKNIRKPQYPLVGEWLSKLHRNYIREQCAAVKKENGSAIYVLTGNELQDTLLSEKSKEQNSDKNGKHLYKNEDIFT